MSTSQPPTDELQELLEAVPASTQDLALRLRARILALAPDIEEEVYVDWRQVAYTCGAGMKRQFCALHLTDEHVDLIFQRGSELSDPAGLLEGVGKKARHVRITTGEGADAPGVVGLVEAAAALVRAEG